MPQPHRALVVIDVQNDYVDGSLPIEYPEVRSSLTNIAKLVDTARAASVPIVMVQNLADAESPFLAEGSRGGQLHECIPDLSCDLHVQKRLPSAFSGTALGPWLQEKGITTITVAGYMTHNCNLSTILDAFHLGLDVEFISDASGSVSYKNQAGYASAEEIHRIVSVVLQSRFAAVLGASEWADIMKHGAPPPQRDSIYCSNRRARGLDVQP